MTLKLVRKQFLNISTPAFILIASFTIPLYAAMEDGSPVTGTSTKVIQFDTEGATFATSTSTIDGLLQEAAHKAQVKEESPVPTSGLFTGIDTGYTFQRPEGWNVYRIPGMSYERVENIDARTWDTLSQEQRQNYFKIEIVVLPRNGLSLHEWIAKQNTYYPRPKVLEQKAMKVAGQFAVYQLEQFGSLVHPVIFIQKDDKIYLLNISNTYEKFQDKIDEFIENFKFK